MPRDSAEDPKESKFSPTYFCENTNINGLAEELAKPKLNLFNNAVIIKNMDEDHSEYSDDSSTNDASLKTENEIDIIHEEVKPEISEEQSIGKRENMSHLNRTEIGPNSSLGLPIDSETWPQQNIEEDDGIIPFYAVRDSETLDCCSTKGKLTSLKDQ
ncbi:hypothetical protein JTB14_028775 [Gonioctena quinquepunctata]|nr:hypothetical protein JTB14_028775 [Gonioctena quinquepunctata]